MSAVKVLIVEDEDLFRQMLISQLTAHPEIEVVGDTASGEEAIELADRLGPEVVLTDIELGRGINGIQVGKTIKSAAPTIGVVLLSVHNDKQFLSETIGDQPAGWSYLLKQNVRDAETLVRAIKGSAWGIVVVDPQLIEEQKPRDNTPLARLTTEQLTVLELVAQGYTDEAIAEKLSIGDALGVRRVLEELYPILGLQRDDSIDPQVSAVIAYLEQSRSR